ncbi:MAG: 5-formyltetrahydrofolate cyclo-ligase [Spirochaetaceae bacterium]|jgi:5-formyltetrahydrofolate cyclo-ligase|nr:5-formyltetrahydrofolate cyclo-ligase [Spirochaetaceae bacterium]
MKQDYKQVEQDLSKTTVRAAMKKRLLELSPEEFISLGEAAAEIIAGQSFWSHTQELLVFVSYKHEISTQAIINKALAAGKKVFVPQIDDKDAGEMHFVRMYSINNIDTDETWAYAKNPCLILTPGLAFDKKGNRLGRGKGFYDRFLGFHLTSLNQKPIVLGLCAEFQLVKALPTDPWDLPVDAVCTEKGFYQ